MNLPIEKIESFCTTKVQLKNIEKLKKKPFSVKNSKQMEYLLDLARSLFAQEKYEALVPILPELNTLVFEGNFDIWGNVEPLLYLLAENPLTTNTQRETIFSQIKSVNDYKDERCQEQYDNYFAKILSSKNITECEDDIQDSIDDEDIEMEYYTRFCAVEQLSQMKIVAEKVDFKTIDFPVWLPAPNYQNQTEMLSEMHKIISDNLAEIRSGKFKKQI